MELRQSLMPPSLDEEQVARLADLVEEIEDCINQGKNPESAIASFNTEVGRTYAKYEFCEIWGYMDLDEFVRMALRTARASTIADISYDELLELMTRVCQRKGTESECAYWFAILEANLPIESLSDLMYYLDEYLEQESRQRELSPQKILDLALVSQKKPAIAR
ncbi:hypothetical protein IQ249_05900 [Lusitaniella coriacea LEGE 07157]|uniref:Uncharacterized protein n=1 Tax=Lusitaniella coriacea LEGE 07157 TaxID=945747 RepID=A0A8J7DV04_9CYAN|nr:hypothetical protein [Lusitaniella coriacea]MBE9115430.1 hypothetical protein [Lusitaniella coriacea LEGE 07157]